MSKLFRASFLIVAACGTLILLSGCGDEDRLIRRSGSLGEQSSRGGQGGESDHREQRTPASSPEGVSHGSGGGYRVLLTDSGPNKIALIKAIREFTGMGLADAKDIVDHAPIPAVSGVSLAEAEAFLHDIEATGARGEIVPMTEGAKVGIPETGRFEVVLLDPGKNHIMVIKAVREITGSGLKDAKDLIDDAPTTVRLCWTREQAEDVVKRLNAAGARAEIR